MPTLFRLLLIVAVLAGLAYAGMIAMVTFLHPQPHDIFENVPLPKGPSGHR